MSKFKVAVIVGSARKGSINQLLAEALGVLGADKLEFSFVKIDDLPLYNQDLEANLPAPVNRMKQAIAAADGVLFVTPEHSRSIPALLKNAIDWGARPWGQSSWPGKPGAVIGTTPGSTGTIVAQHHLRSILGSQGVILAGGEHYITFKPGMIDDQKKVTDESNRTFLQGFVDQFAALVARFAARS